MGTLTLGQALIELSLKLVARVALQYFRVGMFIHCFDSSMKRVPQQKWYSVMQSENWNPECAGNLGTF